MTRVPEGIRGGIVIVGLGSPIRTDDAVGLVIARRLKDQCRLPACHLKELMTGGIQLVEEILGYDTAVIIDAMQSQGGVIGTCHRFEVQDLGARIPSLTHHVGLVEGLELARRLQLDIPAELRVYGIEISDPFTISENMTSRVTDAVPRIVDYICSQEPAIFVPEEETVE